MSSFRAYYSRTSWPILMKQCTCIHWGFAQAKYFYFTKKNRDGSFFFDLFFFLTEMWVRLKNVSKKKNIIKVLMCRIPYACLYRKLRLFLWPYSFSLQAITTGKKPFEQRLAHSFIFHTQQGWSFLTTPSSSSSPALSPAARTEKEERCFPMLCKCYTPLSVLMQKC